MKNTYYFIYLFRYVILYYKSVQKWQTVHPHIHTFRISDFIFSRCRLYTETRTSENNK